MKTATLTTTSFDQGQINTHVNNVEVLEAGSQGMHYLVRLTSGPERGTTKIAHRRSLKFPSPAPSCPPETTDWKALAGKLAKALSDVADAAPYSLDTKTPYFEAQILLVECRRALKGKEQL